MKSKLFYDQIIEGAQKNPPQGYSEVHHIIPRSLGGTNDQSNLVRLSARDHFQCHKLLIEMYDENSQEHRKLVYAFHKMAFGKQSKGYEITPEEYERIKVLNSKATTAMNLERVQNGTHPFAGERGSEFQKLKSKEQLENGTHNFQNGKIQSLITRNSIRNGTNALAGDRGSKFQKNRIANNDHPFCGEQHSKRVIQQNKCRCKWPKSRFMKNKFLKEGDHEIIIWLLYCGDIQVKIRNY